MDNMNERFARRGMHLTAIDYTLVGVFLVQTLFVIITVAGNG